MSNAGYGNHDSDRPGSAAAVIEGRTPPPAPPRAADPKPEPDEATPGAHPATPGEGASSKGAQGDEVDPGAG